MSEEDNAVEQYSNSLFGRGPNDDGYRPRTLFILTDSRSSGMNPRRSIRGSPMSTVFNMLTGQFRRGGSTAVRSNDEYSRRHIENCPTCSRIFQGSAYGDYDGCDHYDGYDSLEYDGDYDEDIGDNRTSIQPHDIESENDQPIAQSFEKRYDKSSCSVKAFWTDDSSNGKALENLDKSRSFSTDKVKSKDRIPGIKNGSDDKDHEVYHNKFKDPESTFDPNNRKFQTTNGADHQAGCETNFPTDNNSSSENIPRSEGSKAKSKKKGVFPISNPIFPQFGTQDSLKLFTGTGTSCDQSVHDTDNEWTIRDIMDEKLQTVDESGEDYGMISLLSSMGPLPQMTRTMRASNAKGQKSNAVELPPLLLALKEFAAANDLELKDGSPDGSCMFYAVADQLQVRTLESDHSATLLRQQAVDYLRNNPLHEDGTHLEQFLSTETWSAYLSRMSQPTQWGDHMILRAMSNMLTRNIIVCNVRPDGEVQQHEIVPMKDQRSDKVALYLGHLGEFHYMSLRPKNWEDKWFAKAKEDKRKDTNFGIPSHSILDNDSEETLFQLCSDMTYVDQVSGVPLPHLSYLIVHLLPPVHHMTITLQTQLRLTDSNGSPLRLEQIGSCGHGTRRILKDISYDEKMKKFHDIKWFSPMTFLSIDKSYIVHCSNSGNANKVIIADESQSHPGYCKLRLATNQLPEKYNVVSDKDATYLAKPELDVHPSDRSAMYSVHPSFECNSWPEQASEWISRDRPVRWPPASLVQRIHRQKCFVIQTPHPASLCAQIEWRFNFSRAEKILLNEALSDNQKQCFDTYQIVVEYHLRNLKRRLSSVHLKSVFFYACEQIGESYWMDSFGGCFLYLIASLLRCLKERKLPNYFIRENNMIDHMDNETVEDIQNALDPIRLFPIESMTFMVERHGYNLGWISRSIKADIPLYVRDVHKDLNRVVRKVFVPTTLKRAMKLANEQQYEYAIEAVNTAYEELLMTPPAIDGSPTRMPRDSSHFLSEVIHNIDDESTAYLFGTYLNRLTGRKIYRNVSSISTLRIRDLTDGEDTGGMGDAPVPKKYQHSTLLRATYLDDLAYRFYSLGKYKISGKFLGHAINLIQKDLTSDTLDVDEISNAELRQDIARQTYENKYMMTSYLVTIMQHLTVLCWPEMLMAKLTQIEEVCERFNNPAVVKYLANMWQRLRYFDRAEEIRTKFGVLGYDEGVNQNYEDMLIDPYNQTQYI